MSEIDYNSKEFSEWFEKGKKKQPSPPRGSSDTAIEAWLMGGAEAYMEEKL